MSLWNKLADGLLALPPGVAEFAIVATSVGASLALTALTFGLAGPIGLGWTIPLTIATVVPLSVATPVSLVLMRLLRELEAARHLALSQASTDALTGLLNRRRWLEVAEREWSRAQADGSPIALLLLDVDDFKQVNDRHGHDAGDRVLQSVAAECFRALRPGDALARWGGEEFVALLPGAPLQAAMQAAERLRAAVQSSAAPGSNSSVAVTVSIGVAAADQPGDATPHATVSTDVQRLLQRADAAMYRAKTGGKNRCACA